MISGRTVKPTPRATDTASSPAPLTLLELPQLIAKRIGHFLAGRETMANRTRACIFYVIMTVEHRVSHRAWHTFRSISSVKLNMAEHNEPCCVGTVKEGELQGVSKQIGDLETYVVGPSTAGTPAVLLLPDAFGFGIPNNK